LEDRDDGAAGQRLGDLYQPLRSHRSTESSRSRTSRSGPRSSTWATTPQARPPQPTLVTVEVAGVEEDRGDPAAGALTSGAHPDLGTPDLGGGLGLAHLDPVKPQARGAGHRGAAGVGLVDVHLDPVQPG